MTFRSIVHIRKLLRVFAYVCKFLKILKFKIKTCENLKNCTCSLETLCIHDLDYAEILLIGIYQKVNFPLIISYFFKQTKSAPSIVHQLQLFMLDGVIRSRGRISNSTLPYDSKHPILLSSNCPLTKLIILDAGPHSILHG